MGFEFGEGHFDRVEIRAVWRQKEEPCSSRLEDRLGFFAFMAGQIIEDDDIARFESWRELCLDVGLEDLAVHGAIDDPGRRQSIASQSGDKGLCAPMPEGSPGFQAVSSSSPSPQPGHLGGRACLVNKDKPMRFLTHAGLAAFLPYPAVRRDLSAFGFGCQQCFF